MRKFIKLDEDRYLVKNSSGLIVSKEDIIVEDITSNECVKDMVENADSSIKKAKQTKRTNSKPKRTRN